MELESYTRTANYGAGEGTESIEEYPCYCGKGKIVYDDCDVPGFREHDVYIECPECSKNYTVARIERFGRRQVVKNSEIIPIYIKAGDIRLYELLENASNSDNLDYIKEQLDTIYNSLKDRILD